MYSSVNGFISISPTAGSKLDERVGGQADQDGSQETFDLFTGGKLLSWKKVENEQNIWQ